MSSGSRFFVVNNIKLPINASPEEAFFVARKRLAELSVSARDVDFKIYKRSVDARDRKDIKFVYSVSCNGNLPEISEDRLLRHSVSSHESVELGEIR